MLAKICINKKEYTCNLNEGIDISIPISHGEDNLEAWYIPKPNISPVKTENWTGSVKACLLYTSPSPRDGATSRMPSSA